MKVAYSTLQFHLKVIIVISISALVDDLSDPVKVTKIRFICGPDSIIYLIKDKQTREVLKTSLNLLQIINFIFELLIVLRTPLYMTNLT